MTTVLANPNQVAWTYVNEHQTSYRVRAKYAIVAQPVGTGGLVGGSSADADTPRMPLGLKPRYVIVAGNTTKKIRKVTCYDTSCALWTGDTQVVTLSIDGVDEICTVTGWVGEVSHGGIADTAHQ